MNPKLTSVNFCLKTYSVLYGMKKNSDGIFRLLTLSLFLTESISPAAY